MRDSPILRQATLHRMRVALPAEARPAPFQAPLTLQRSPLQPSGSPLTMDDAQREVQMAVELEKRLQALRGHIEQEVSARDVEARGRCENNEKRRAEEHAQRMGALDAVLQDVKQAHVARLKELSSQATALAYAALCRVVEPHPERERLLGDLIDHGIRQLQGQPLLAIRLNSSDLELLLSHEVGCDLRERYPAVKWVSDPSLARASCDFDTDRGTLEAGLQTQLARLAQLWNQVEADADKDTENNSDAGTGITPTANLGRPD